MLKRLIYTAGKHAKRRQKKTAYAEGESPCAYAALIQDSVSIIPNRRINTDFTLVGFVVNVVQLIRFQIVNSLYCSHNDSSYSALVSFSHYIINISWDVRHHPSKAKIHIYLQIASILIDFISFLIKFSLTGNIFAIKMRFV